MQRTLIGALAALILTACSTDTTETPDLNTQDIYASIAPTLTTRVELNDQKQTVWTTGDQIVVHGPENMRLYEFNGETGDRNGTFTHIGNFNVTDYATKYACDRYYAYIYEGSATIGTASGTPVLFMNAQATQSYKKESYGVGDNPILGTSDDGTNFSFQNMLGYLRLSITGDQAVQTITLTGNNNEVIAGQLYTPINNIPTIFWNTKGTTITLDCGEGVQLTDTPTEFYIVVPPVTFTKGFTVTLNLTDGTIFPKSTSKAVTIERNTIQPMKHFATGGDVQWQIVTLYHTGTQVAAPLLNNATGYIEWGDGTTSILGEVTSFDYTDGAASHTITVKAANASTVELNSCAGITKLDLSNF